MQGTMKYMNVQQQQQQYTALRYVVFFTPLSAMLYYPSVFVSVDHVVCYTYMYCIYVYIHLHIYCIYISILGFCSIVIQVFVYAGHGDFRTIEQS